MSAPPSVFLDANVLFDRTTTDWLVMLTLDRQPTQPPFRLLWSLDVLLEAGARWRDEHPDVPSGGLEEWFSRFGRYLADGQVKRFDPAAYPTPPGDFGDRHVVAAAAAGGADYLLTKDQSLLDWDGADEFFETWTPDEFLVLIDERDPQLVDRRLADEVRYRLSRAGDGWAQGPAGAISRLRDVGAVHFAARLRERHGGTM